MLSASIFVRNFVGCRGAFPDCNTPFSILKMSGQVSDVLLKRKPSLHTYAMPFRKTTVSLHKSLRHGSLRLKSSWYCHHICKKPLYTIGSPRVEFQVNHVDDSDTIQWQPFWCKDQYSTPSPILSPGTRSFPLLQAWTQSK